MNKLKRLLKFVKPYQKEALGALFLLIAVIFVDLSLPRLIQRLIDKGVAAGDSAVILNTALLMIGLATLNALMMIGNTILAACVSQNFAADLRAALFRQVQTFSFGNLDQLRTGKLIIRLTSDVNMIQMMLLMALRIMTRAPLLMLGSSVLLIVTSPRLSLIVAVFLPITIGFLRFFIKLAQPLFLRVQERLDSLNQVLQENLAGARVVKAFVRTNYENQRFALTNEALTVENVKVRRLMAVLPPTMFLILNLGMVAVIWFGGQEAITGDLTIGQIMAFTNYLLMTMFPLLLMGMLAARLPQATASAERIVEVLDSQPQVRERPNARTITAAGRVAFENVSFRYNLSGHEEVLTDINLVAEPGQTVALLGATGSGKSTLINLIPRFYEVESGQVTLDGVDIRELTLDSLRGQIGFALQEAILFSVSVRDNIRYGKPEATDEEVVAAAKAAQADDFIRALPEGYDTQVEQRGANLSGGQKQRIAIARALLVQPAVLILDDSTSAVDVETEAKIQAALAELRGDKTAFIIAQRISTVLTADKIVVLENGQIAAEGTHAELLQSSPIYQEIYDSQLGDGPTVRQAA